MQEQIRRRRQYVLPVQFDPSSSMARLHDRVWGTLQTLCANEGREYKRCFVRILGDNRVNVARSTVYVLDEGVIDSPRCFSAAPAPAPSPASSSSSSSPASSSSSRRKKRSLLQPPEVDPAPALFTITPNGWRVATVVSAQVFVSETAIRGDQMHYRFQLVNLVDASEAVVGEWNSKLASAFATLEPHFDDRSRPTLNKMSKELILGVHTFRVQNMLCAEWEAAKQRAGDEEELRCMLALERQHTLESLAAANEKTAAKRARVAQALGGHLPRDPHGLLSAAELLAILDVVAPEGTKRVWLQAVLDMLIMLEAGEAVRMPLVVRFLGAVDRMKQRFWDAYKQDTLAELWSSTVLHPRPPQDGLLEFRAAVFVFWKVSEKFPCALEDLARQKNFRLFSLRVGGLPTATSTEECFHQLFPTS